MSCSKLRKPRGLRIPSLFEEKTARQLNANFKVVRFLSWCRFLCGRLGLWSCPGRCWSVVVWPVLCSAPGSCRPLLFLLPVVGFCSLPPEALIRWRLCGLHKRRETLMLLFSCCSFSRETELEELWASSTDRRLVSSCVRNSDLQVYSGHQDKEAESCPGK